MFSTDRDLGTLKIRVFFSFFFPPQTCRPTPENPQCGAGPRHRRGGRLWRRERRHTKQRLLSFSRVADCRLRASPPSTTPPSTGAPARHPHLGHLHRQLRLLSSCAPAWSRSRSPPQSPQSVTPPSTGAPTWSWPRFPPRSPSATTPSPTAAATCLVRRRYHRLRLRRIPHVALHTAAAPCLRLCLRRLRPGGVQRPQRHATAGSGYAASSRSTTASARGRAHRADQRRPNKGQNNVGHGDTRVSRHRVGPRPSARPQERCEQCKASPRCNRQLGLADE